MKRALIGCAIVLTTVAALSSSLAQAERVYYRWVDERGNPMHSDRPPPKGIDYEVVSTGSSFKRPVDADEGAVPPEVEPSPGNDFKAVKTKEPKFEKNPEFCQRGKDNLETLNTSARIRMRNEAGELTYIDEAEKELQKKQATDNIKMHCDD